MNSVEVAVIIAAVLLGATVKSVTGMGLPIIAIPIISVFTNAETAIAVLALPNAAQNLVMALRHRSHLADTVGLGRLTLAGLGGAVIGSLLLGVVPEALLLSVLVVLVTWYLISSIRSPELAIDRAVALRWSPVAGFVGGVFQGGAGISGPIIGTWHHALRLPRGAFVLSVSSIFLVAGTTQVVVLGSTGLLDGRLTVSALLSVLVLATIPLGRSLSQRLSGPGFDRAVLGLLAVSLIALVADLLTGLIG